MSGKQYSLGVAISDLLLADLARNNGDITSTLGPLLESTLAVLMTIEELSGGSGVVTAFTDDMLNTYCSVKESQKNGK
jgi:hypothetical protein